MCPGSVLGLSLYISAVLIISRIWQWKSRAPSKRNILLRHFSGSSFHHWKPSFLPGFYVFLCSCLLTPSKLGHLSNSYLLLVFICELFREVFSHQTSYPRQHTHIEETLLLHFLFLLFFSTRFLVAWLSLSQSSKEIKLRDVRCLGVWFSCNLLASINATTNTK